MIRLRFLTLPLPPSLESCTPRALWTSHLGLHRAPLFDPEASRVTLSSRVMTCRMHQGEAPKKSGQPHLFRRASSLLLGNAASVQDLHLNFLEVTKLPRGCHEASQDLLVNEITCWLINRRGCHLHVISTGGFMTLPPGLNEKGHHPNHPTFQIHPLCFHLIYQYNIYIYIYSRSREFLR